MTVKSQLENIFFETFIEVDEAARVLLVRGASDEWDSLKHVELLFEIEDTFGILLSDEDASNIKDFNSAFEILRKYHLDK